MGQIQLVEHWGDVDAVLQGLGWEWVVEEGCANYLSGEAVSLPEQEAEALLTAADQLYDMLLKAIPEGLPDDFLRLLDIPPTLWKVVRQSWNDDRHLHLYGRFDLAMTAYGPKLLEFNADTATSIPETAVVQWASLAAANKHDAEQSSGLYEALVEQFRAWKVLNDDLEPALVLAYIGASAEDYTNCEVLAQAAGEAGFETHLCPVAELSVATGGGERGVWAEVGAGKWRLFPFLFKLVPWEQIAWEEPRLTDELVQLIQSRNVVVANPAYTLLFQSKAILAWLSEYYADHPLLLPASLYPLEGKHVRKPFFGREGQNVEVVDRVVQERTSGEYGLQKMLYQKWAELPRDQEGRVYQAGVFWAGEGCAIGFRRDKRIITNLSQFVPHLIQS
jgi:glutathionylspermidine synthase